MDNIKQVCIMHPSDYRPLIAANNMQRSDLHLYEDSLLYGNTLIVPRSDCPIAKAYCLSNEDFEQRFGSLEHYLKER